MNAIAKFNPITFVIGLIRMRVARIGYNVTMQCIVNDMYAEYTGNKLPWRLAAAKSATLRFALRPWHKDFDTGVHDALTMAEYHGL